MNCTVTELIEKLKTMPPNLKVQVRPKYYGDLKRWDSAPVTVSGVSEMHPEGGEKNVTILV